MRCRIEGNQGESEVANIKTVANELGIPMLL